MDKRTIIFVLALSLTLFLVNLFFEQRNTDNLRDWNTQQAAKKTEKIQKLSEDLKTRTASLSALPVVTLYADADAQQPLATAVQVEKNVLALAWSKEIPKNVYAKPMASKEKAKPLSLVKAPENVGSPVIYQETGAEKLRVEELPEFGKYELQLLLPQQNSAVVYVSDFANGHLEIPAEKVAQLKNELSPEAPSKMPSIPAAIALLKTSTGYLPAAIYYGGTRKELIPIETLPALSTLVTKPEQKVVETAGQKSGEKFYVLETPYQQLVFSNYGGALVEINLPFQNKLDEQSAVREIEYDRDMLERHPYNAHFPAHAFYTYEKKGEGFTEHKEGALGGYYPLLRRDLMAQDKRKSVRVQPRYYALNIVSEYPETAELVYEVKSFDKDQIVFEAAQGHRRITKTFSVNSEVQAPYCIDLKLNIQGDSRGLWITSGIPEVEWISGSPAPAMKYRITRNQKVEIENIDLPNDSVTMTSAYLDWVCNSNGFFGVIMDPLGDIDSGYRAQKVSGSVVPSRLVAIDQEFKRFDPENMPGYMMMLPLKSVGGSMHFRVFAGPFAGSVMNKIDEVYSNPATGYNPDYIACQSFHGWFSFISEPFAKFLFILMKFFYNVTGSWAFSIVLLTVALRVMLYPLNAWSTKSMVRMQQIAPEVTAIQEKYKKDPKKAQLEIMNLYRDRGVNPVSGCFPLLIQMPFLIGMFDLLKSTYELRGAGFIPGWIDNLTSPDVLFTWGMSLPLIGNQFHLLPILLGAVMFFQQRYMSAVPIDPSQMTDQQRQQRFMGNIMAVVFTVMFYNFPSGLNIYWLSSMLLGILQQWWTTKRLKKIVVPANQTVILAKPKK